MDAAAADVLARIEAAFPARRAIRFDPMVNSDQGEEPLLTAKAFADKDDWTRLEAEWLDAAPKELGTALSFLSDEAVCFYIPAFITADVRGKLNRAEPAFHLSHGFDNYSRNQPITPRSAETWTDYAKRRWSYLTPEQARAIVDFLEWKVGKDGPDIAYGAAEALSAFWYERAVGAPNGS